MLCLWRRWRVAAPTSGETDGAQQPSLPCFNINQLLNFRFRGVGAEMLGSCNNRCDWTDARVVGPGLPVCFALTTLSRGQTESGETCFLKRRALLSNSRSNWIPTCFSYSVWFCSLEFA